MKVGGKERASELSSVPLWEVNLSAEAEVTD